MKPLYSCIFPFCCICLTATRMVHSERSSLLYKSRDGDFVIGALLALREFDEVSQACGPITDLGAVRRAEAVAFAVGEINKDDDILHNVTLGFEIHDTCYDGSVALGSSLKFTKQYRNGRDNVIGLVGTSLSSTASVTAQLLTNFNMTMVSHFATSDDLSNSYRYPYFMRTIAPDSYQVNAIIDILQFYRWEYVAFVYTENIYGRQAYDIFQRKIVSTDICVPYSRGLTVTDDESVYQETLDELLELREQSLISVVILFAELENMRLLMQTAFNRGVTGQFIWIGSDALGIPCLNSVKDIEEAALGTLTMIPKAGIAENFEEHFQRERSKNTSDNPWMEEYNREFTGDDACPSFESLVMDAVGVLARGMDELLTLKCGTPPDDACKENVLKDNRELLHRLLLNVTFNSSSNGPIFFLDRGDSLGRYDIRHLDTISGRYQFQTVGNWTAEDGLDMKRSLHWYIEDKERYSGTGVPKSICMEPCATDQRRISSEDRPCCWDCEDCDDDKLVINGSCAESCVDPSSNSYRWPSEDRQSCEDLSHQIRSGRPEAIVIICAGTLGMTLTLISTAIYYRKREERLIKASSRELSYVIAIGVFFTYLATVIFMIDPSPVTCALRRTLPHVAVSLIYVSIATITVRLYRIFEAGRKSLRRPKFIHPKSQIMITLSLSVVPLVWAIVWLCVQPPTVEKEVVADGDQRFVTKLCSTSIAHRIGQLSWDTAVVLLCCYFAFRARNLPANYNQSRFIAFSVFSTLVVYIAFAPAFATTDSSTQDLYSALGLLIQATVILSLVIVVRLYAVMYAHVTPTESSASGNPTPQPGAEGSHNYTKDDSGKPVSSICRSSSKL